MAPSQFSARTSPWAVQVVGIFEPRLELDLSCQLLLAPHPRLAPNSGAPISRFLPAPVRRRHPHHPSCPSRSDGLVAGCCWCAGAPRRPIRSVGLAPSSHRLTIAPRRRTARDSLNGIRRSRAASMLSRYEFSRRAFCFACTFRFACLGLWRCLVVVTSRASE